MCVFVIRFWLTLSSLLLLGLALSQAAPLILFEDIQYKGTRVEYHKRTDGCTNFRGKMNDFFSSVQLSAGECFLLCQDQYCRGKCVEIQRSVENLLALEINDAISSFKPCPKGDRDLQKGKRNILGVTPLLLPTSSSLIVEASSTTPSLHSELLSTSTKSSSSSSEHPLSLSTGENLSQLAGTSADAKEDLSISSAQPNLTVDKKSLQNSKEQMRRRNLLLLRSLIPKALISSQLPSTNSIDTILTNTDWREAIREDKDSELLNSGNFDKTVENLRSGSFLEGEQMPASQSILKDLNSVLLLVSASDLTDKETTYASSSPSSVKSLETNNIVITSSNSPVIVNGNVNDDDDIL